MSLWRRRIKASDAVLIRSADSFADQREPPLWLGNYVRLNSGGPVMMVVDHDDDCAVVVVSWRDGGGSVCERLIPIACVHRVSVASFASAGSEAL
jgi:uncharacterized protein YodC (DUF2158 family)